VIGLLTDPEQGGHRADGHPERPERVRAILDAMAASALGLKARPAPPASEALIDQVHDPQYVATLDRAAAAGGGYLDPDTYITPQSMVAARAAAGAAVEGVEQVLSGAYQHAFAVVRPPGHHAERARAMGFCLLNNVGIGLAAGRAKGVRRIAVLDFDVHHGNGTQHSFQKDAEVFYASTHQYPFYPGTGSASERGEFDNVLNLPLKVGTGDRDFLAAWEKKIGPALEAFKPQFMLVSAGFDAHQDDPLAGLEVTTDGYRNLAHLIRGWAIKYCGDRSVWVLEGGYDLKAIADSAVACVEVLAAEDHDGSRTRGQPGGTRLQ
jgi:acetoin utilization deacetylase AcuC-like enzyme